MRHGGQNFEKVLQKNSILESNIMSNHRSKSKVMPLATILIEWSEFSISVAKSWLAHGSDT